MRFSAIAVAAILCFIIASLTLSVPVSSSAVHVSNPYKSLELSNRASLDEIKKSYKRLAKLYHPDKNDKPEAEDKFLEIQAAYEILTDPQRKSDYDRTGNTQANNQQQQHHYQHRRWGFGFSDPVMESAYAKYSENNELYSHSVKLTNANFDSYFNYQLSQSRVPEVWMIYVYSVYCEKCRGLDSQFDAAAMLIASKFKGLVRFGRVHADFESQLARRLGVNSAPALYSVSLFPSDPKQLRQKSVSLKFGASKSDILSHIGSIYNEFNSIRELDSLAKVNEFESQYKLSMKFIDNGRLNTPIQLSDSVMNFLHYSTLIVIGKTNRPNIVINYLSSYYKDRMNIIYLPLNSFPSTHYPALHQAIPIPLKDFYDFQSQQANLPWFYLWRGLQFSSSFPGHPAFLPIRIDLPVSFSPSESHSPDSQYDLTRYIRLLDLNEFQYLPRLDDTNFYRLCHSRSLISSSVVPDRSLIDSEFHGRNVNAQIQTRKLSFILFSDHGFHSPAGSHSLFSPESPIQSVIREFNLQVSWIDSSTQSEFVSYFRRNPDYPNAEKTRGILIRAETGEFLPYIVDETEEQSNLKDANIASGVKLQDWLQLQLSVVKTHSSRSKIQFWYSASNHGGFPYPESEVRLSLARRFLDFLSYLSDSLPILHWFNPIGWLTSLGFLSFCFVLLFFFLISQSISVKVF